MYRVYVTYNDKAFYEGTYETYSSAYYVLCIYAMCKEAKAVMIIDNETGEILIDYLKNRFQPSA